MPAARMRALFQHAGAPQQAIDLIKEVVDTCRICREWQSAAPRTMTTGNFVGAFNDELQVDLLFWREKPVLHMIDKCIRWGMAVIIPNRETTTILNAITAGWFRLFGPPKKMSSDKEGAIVSDAGALWADRWGIQLDPRPITAHARMIERHNKILRDVLHRISGQLEEDQV